MLPGRGGAFVELDARPPGVPAAFPDGLPSDPHVDVVGMAIVVCLGEIRGCKEAQGADLVGLRFVNVAGMTTNRGLLERDWWFETQESQGADLAGFGSFDVMQRKDHPCPWGCRGIIC